MASSSTRKRGSKAFWPRVRALKSTAVVNSWQSCKATGDSNFLGFPAYKAGMTHVGMIDNFSHTLTKGTEINVPVTVLEVPAIRVLSIKLLAKDEYANLQVVKEISALIKDKNLSRKLSVQKKESAIPTIEELIEFSQTAEVSELRVKVSTSPSETGIGKKKPEVLELGISGSVDNQITFALSKLGQEVKASEVLKAGQLVDSHGITIGKGFTGAVKRFGVKLTSHKSEKSRRHAGNVGAWTPSRVLTTIPLAGQHGFHERTEWNKWILKISDNVEEINQIAGFKSYGVVKNEYLVMKGSIQGHKKRLVTLSLAARPNKRYPKVAPEITYIRK
jgi:large subunit ribosomal protein L3